MTVAFGLATVVLVALAGYRDGRLLVWDEPVQRFVERHRAGPVDDALAALTHLASSALLWPLAVGTLILLWPRCRALSYAIAVALVGSVLVTYGLKDVVGRERPTTSQLVASDFHAFPSGHVINAVAYWGLLPLIVGLLSDRRGLWWASVVFAAAVVVVVSFSRVYLGVHWLSDVLGGLLAGAVVLLAADATFRFAHRRRPCRSPVP